MREPALNSPVRHPSEGARQTILVVHDDEMTCDVLRRFLERAGFAVVTASHGGEGLKRFQEAPVDLILTDMVMPIMDGVELIRTLRKEGAAVPIVAVSGVDEWSRYLGMAMRLGAQAALQTPCGSTELIDTVRRVLAESRTANV